MSLDMHLSVVLACESPSSCPFLVYFWSPLDTCIQWQDVSGSLYEHVLSSRLDWKSKLPAL